MAEGEVRAGGSGPPAGAALSIRAVGKLSICVGGKDIETIGRKSRALMGYLALSETGEETRERLIGLLWSESEEQKARASLRQSLHEIREAMDQAGFDGFHADRMAITLDRSRVDVDLWSALDEAAAGRAHPLLLESEQPIDRLLQEFEVLDPAFRIWLLAKRQTLADRLMRSLESAMRDARKPPAAREALARAVRNLDPTHEEAARLLIRGRASAGDIGAALRVYKTLWDLLDDEFDVEPSKETQELIAAIKLGQPEAGRADGTAPAITMSEERPAVTSAPAVPPTMVEPPRRRIRPKLMVSIAEFREAEPKQESRYLLQGFRMELIACLIRFREWVVCDATAAPTRSDASQGPDSSEYLIEASALPTRDSGLRVVITLRDLATNAYLWSERLTISVANWFEVQQHVVRRITTALNVHLSAGRLSSVAHRPPGDLRAHDLWLLGQATFLNFDPQNWERARSLFRQVIAEMPDFAPAYSSLAQLNNSEHIVRPGVFRDPARSEQSLQYAREAARLDPIDSRSQLCLGWSHAMVKQYDQAMIYIPLAYELNENDPWTLVSCANCYAFCGRPELAGRIADHTLRLPLSPTPLQWAYHAAIRFMAADYAGTVQAAVAAGDVTPSAPGYKTAALFHLGDDVGAVAELRRFHEVIRSRWAGSEPASDANIARWFLTMFPIRRPEDWKRLRDGLAGAGASVDGLAHHQW